MSDLMIRIVPGDATDTAALTAAMSERLPLLSGVEDVEVEAFTGLGERVDPVSITETLGSITLIVGAVRLTLGEANKLLQEIRGLLTAATGVKEATLQLVGKRPVAIEKATPEQVVGETAEL
jgi:hypothetical protein